MPSKTKCEDTFVELDEFEKQEELIHRQKNDLRFTRMEIQPLNKSDTSQKEYKELVCLTPRSTTVVKLGFKIC